MSREFWLPIGLLVIISLIITACGPSATLETVVVTEIVEPEITTVPTEAPTATEFVTEEPAVEPTEKELEKDVALVVETLEGTVTVEHPSGAEYLADEEYVITTDGMGHALLTHPDDRNLSVEIYSDTRLRVVDVKSDYALLFLEVGSILSTVESGGVRLVVSGVVGDCEPVGTQWGNDVDELGYMTVTVIEGQVEFTPQDGGTSVVVSAGNQLVASPDSPVVRPIFTRSVYFDVSLDDYEREKEKQEEPDSIFGLYSDMASELENAGYTLVEGSDLLDVVDVEDPSTYKTLVILDPEKSLGADYIDAIQAWVAQGRSLFIVGERGDAFARSSINELLSPYGIAFTGESVEDAIASSFDPDHPVTQGVELLRIDGCGALEVDGAIPLGYTDSGHVMLAVAETDSGGRIVTLADSTTLSNTYWGISDVERLTKQVFDWLAWHWAGP